MPPAVPGTRRGAAPVRPRPATESAPRWRQAHLNPAMSSRWRAILSAIGVIVVLAACAVGSFLIVRDEQQGVQAQADSSTPKPTIVPVDISSREVDPTPLTAAEVFPNNSIVIDPAKPDQVYKLIAKPQELTDCKSATKGELTKLLSSLGCSQVVRASMRSPDNYLVTGGIFNLDTVASAEKAWESVKTLVADQKGGFVGYAPTSDRSARPLVLAATQVAWNMKGHYLAYCVIARADGEEIPDGDLFAEQIMFDIVEIYLKGTVLEARATDPVSDASADPSAAPSTSP